MTTQPKGRPSSQDTAIGQSWVKALVDSKKKPKGRKAYSDKPNTHAEPVRLVVGIASVIEVVDFYRRRT